MDNPLIQVRLCSVEDCGGRLYAKDLCGKHYARMLRTGTLEARVHNPKPVVCTVEGCDGEPVGRGLCNGHYQRLRKTGEIGGPLARRRVQAEVCEVPDCDVKVYARDLCNRHYKRFMTYGDPTGGPGRGRPGRPSKWAGVSCSVAGCESEVLSVGLCSLHYTRKVKKGDVGGPEQMLGRPLEGDENVHHRNGIRDDNRPENLELWVSAQPPRQNVEEIAAYMREWLVKYEADVAVLTAAHQPIEQKEP